MRIQNLMRSIAAASLVISTSAYAGPDEDVRDTARADADKFRADGWPQQRCSLSGYFSDGGHIYQSWGELQVGDKLLYLADNDVTGQTAERIVEVLKTIPPNALLPVRIERGGKALDVEVPCASAATIHDADLAVLDLAGHKKFPECVAEAEKVADKSQMAAIMAYRCAMVKNPQNYDLGKMVRRIAEPRIAEAAYDPTKREAAVQGLRQARGTLGEGAFATLVEKTRRWPGGESFFDDSKPDWFAMRKAAESAVLVGFFDPSSAVFEWPSGFTYGSWKPLLQARIDGWWTCGRINAKNRMGGYVGSRSFVVVMDDSGSVLYNETGSGGNYDILGSQCQQSLASLPPPPPEFFRSSAVTAKPDTAAPSMVNELKALASLYESGALTEDEYTAAKAKILAQ